jgi:hypothetical protein
MTTLVEEVAAAVEQLFADQAVRWPDPPDIGAELVATLLLASPRTAARVRRTLRVLVERADTLTELVDGLDAAAICRYGQAGDGETAAALLDISDQRRRRQG